MLGPAGSRVTPRVTLQAAQNRVSAAPLATNLVQITATGSSPRAAETLANAVANQLVVFVTSSNMSNGSSALAGLEAQATDLTKQVNKYDQEIQVEQAAIAIAPYSAIAQQDTQLLASLTTAQADASLQLQSVNSQIASAKLNSAATNGGTEVIQHASSATGPSLLIRLAPDRHWSCSWVAHRRAIRHPPAAGLKPHDPRRDRRGRRRSCRALIERQAFDQILRVADAVAGARTGRDGNVERPKSAEPIGRLPRPGGGY